jgi:beta-carotene 3-hydroxylase
VTPLAALAIVAATVVGAELAATAVHRFVMHGPGWAWHRSHHEPGPRRWERNDLYAAAFGAADVALFAFAGGPQRTAWWVALGVAVYGLGVAWVHDGLVHRRWPAGRVPSRGWLARLARAHRLHHAVRGRDGAVSFGFLWAPPPERLARTLRARGTRVDDPDGGTRRR